jgi:uncharacterized protein YukE
MDIQTLVITSIVGIITAIISSGIFSLIAQKRLTSAKVDTEEETAKKLEAETADLIQKSAGELVMAYKNQYLEVKKELKETREEFNIIKKELTSRIVALEDELKDAYVEIKRQDGIIKELNRRMTKSGQ